MTITIRPELFQDDIEETDGISNSCVSEKFVTVTVPGGESRLVTIDSNTSYGSPKNFSEIINADKTYRLLVDGATLGNSNTITTTVTLKVFNNNVLESISRLTRTHTENIC